MSVTDWSLRTGHVVVCGLHDDGLRMVEQLHAAGVPALVVDDEPDLRLPSVLADLGVEWLRADAARPETLRAAGLEGATALVCTASDDLRALAIALLARELRPGLRVVVQMRNAAVGRALSDVGVVVLDAAEIAAPSLVEACLQPGAHELRLAERDFWVVETTVPRSAQLRELYGDLAPLALVPGDGGAAALPPGRDVRATQGDSVVLVGSVGALGETGLVQPPARRGEQTFVGARAPREPTKRQANLLLFAVRDIDRRIKRAVLALGLLVAVSVSVLTLGYRDAGGARMSVLDAVYFTVETIGTVGFGDFYFRDQAPWLRMWAICLMVVGATLATVFFALLTNVLISRTIASSLGRRRMTGLSGHVVVVGLGAVGLAVVERLQAAGVDVVVVEADDQNRFLGQLRAQRVPVVVADATLSDTWARSAWRTLVRSRSPPATTWPTSRPGSRSVTSWVRAGAPSRWWCASSTVGWPTPWRAASRSATSGLRRPWRLRGSSGPRSGSTCSRRCTSAGSRCWWPGCRSRARSSAPGWRRCRRSSS